MVPWYWIIVAAVVGFIIGGAFMYFLVDISRHYENIINTGDKCGVKGKKGGK